jgi:outer membrane protein OmpA-like peptidoglycan-associated protein
MFLHVVPASTAGKRRPVRRFVPVAAMFGLLTAGCSWFGGSSDQSPPPSTTAAPSDASGQPASFPNLASVPDQAPPSTPKIDRDKLVQGLTADRSHAEYTDQSLGEETANVPAAAPPPPEPKAADQGAAPASGAPAAQAGGDATPPPPAPPQIAALPADLGTATALIYFAPASTNLTDHDRAVLHDVAVAYSKERSTRLRIVGHASATETAGGGAAGGASQFDTALGRADAVAKALIGMGVPARVLETTTGGATYDETQPNGVAANRRVEVYIGP